MKGDGNERKRNTEELNHHLGYLKGFCNYMENDFIFYGLSKTKTKTPSFANTFLETYRTSQ